MPVVVENEQPRNGQQTGRLIDPFVPRNFVLRGVADHGHSLDVVGKAVSGVRFKKSVGVGAQ